jgi:acyl dehydratase
VAHARFVLLTAAMPIDRDKALAATFPVGCASWSNDDVILYHLGIGAGVPPTDPNELAYTFEKNLKVLPSYAVVVKFTPHGDILNVPGLEFNPFMLLHGEQDVEVHAPLPVTAEGVTGEMRIADVYDKGKAAVAIVEIRAKDAAGVPLFTNRMALFLRGEGGFGGPPGPKTQNAAPERSPDGVIESRSFPQQALLYRLNGDKNPLHADPDFAAMGGFDRPIIHGLCSYGITLKAIVDRVLDGDVTRVARYAARFAGVAFPGETYVTAYWREGETIFLQAKAKERDALVISNAAVTVRA